MCVYLREIGGICRYSVPPAVIPCFVPVHFAILLCRAELFPDSSEGNGRAEGLWDREEVQSEARKQEAKPGAAEMMEAQCWFTPCSTGGLCRLISPVEMGI